MGQIVRWQCPKCERFFRVAAAGKMPQACPQCQQSARKASSKNGAAPSASTVDDFDDILSQAEDAGPPVAVAPPPVNSPRPDEFEEVETSEAPPVATKPNPPMIGDRSTIESRWRFTPQTACFGFVAFGALMFTFGMGYWAGRATVGVPDRPAASGPTPELIAKSEPAEKPAAIVPEPQPVADLAPVPNRPPVQAPVDPQPIQLANVPEVQPDLVEAAPIAEDKNVVPLENEKPEIAGTPLEKLKLEEIAIKRDTLIQRRILLVDEVTSLNSLSADYQADLAQYQTDAGQIRRQMAALETQATQTQQQSQSNFITADQRVGLQQQYQRLSAEHSAASQALQKVTAAAAPISTKLKGVTQKLAARKKEADDLQHQANTLRDEWLEVTDPFGKLDSGDAAAALAVFDEWIELDREFVAAYIARGLAYYSLEHFQNAIEDFETALQLIPNYPPAMAGKALALSVGVSQTQGRLAFREAVRLTKDSWFVYLCQGLAEREHRDYRSAVAHFRKATELGSDEPAAFHHLARLLTGCPDAEWRDGAEALKAAEKAHRLSNGEVWIYIDTLAVAHAENSEFEKAIQFQKQALELAPEPATDACRQRLERYENRQPFRLP